MARTIETPRSPTAPFRLLTFAPVVPAAVLSPQLQTTIRDIAKLAKLDPESFEMIARIARQLASTNTDRDEDGEIDSNLARVAKWLFYNPRTASGLARGIAAVERDEQEGGR